MAPGDLSKQWPPRSVNPGRATYAEDMEETQLISRQEAAVILGVSARTINRYMNAGYLTPTYERHRGQLVPRYSRFDVEELAHSRNSQERFVPNPLCS